MTHVSGNEVPVDYSQKLDIRVGKILAGDDFPKARKPLYKLTMDFGELGVKKTGAGLKQFHSKEELLGRLVIAVVNFPPRQIASFRSECLALAAITKEKKTVLLKPDKETEAGAKIFCHSDSLETDISSKWNCRRLLLSFEHEGRQSFFDPLDQPELVHHELAHGVHILRFHLQKNIPFARDYVDLLNFL